MTRPTSLNDRLFTALSAVVLLAPLPLGANRPWSWSLLACLSAILALVWVAGRVRGRCRPGLPLQYLAIPATLFAVALLWAGVQSLSLVPTSWAYPLWDEARQALGEDLPATVSGDPQKTLTALMRLLSYGLIFFLATQLGRAHHRATWALKATGLAILAYGLYALVNFAFELEMILWLDKWAYLGDATGTFVGRAAFGAFAGLGVLTCQALALHHARPQRATLRPSERLERLLARTVPWMAAAAVLWLAVVASHSRGALLVTGIASIVFLCISMASRMIRLRSGLFLLFLIAGLGAGALLLDGGVTLARMSGEGDLTGDRPNLLRLTWAAIQDAPWLGHGLGAFEQTFLPYRDFSLPRPVIYDYAHNSWAEVIMDLGWIAGSCLILACVFPVFRCMIGAMRRQKGQIFPILALSMACLLGAQAVIDFTIQIPAIAALFAYWLGLGYGQSWSSQQAGNDGVHD